MKNLFLITSSILLSLNSSAQKVTVEEVKETFSMGTATCLKVFVPYTEKDRVTKEWKRILKDLQSKVDDNKGTIFADNCVIKEFGTGTVDVYSKVDDLKEVGSILYVAYDFNGGYISSDNYPDKISSAKTILLNHAKTWSMKTATDMVENENKKLNKLNNQQKNLEGDNKDLKETIEKNKNRTGKAENELKYTEQALEKKRDEVTIQKKVVDNSAGATEEQKKSSLKVYNNLKDDQLSLEKKVRNLNNDIIDYKDNVTKAERSLVENEKDQERKKTEIETQSKVLAKTQDKLKEVGESALM